MRIANRAGLIPTCLLMLPGIAYLGCCCKDPVIKLFYCIFGDQLFYNNPERCVAFAFFFFIVISLYMLPVRWLCNKEDKKAFFAFHIGLFMMYLVPLSLLIFAFCSLFSYAIYKGLTPKCFCGFIFVISGYSVMALAFIYWKVFRYLLMALLLLFSALSLHCLIKDPQALGMIMLVPGTFSAIAFCVLIYNLLRKKKIETDNGGQSK